MTTTTIKAGFGLVVTGIATMLGGLDGALYTLLVFMSIDYITGVAVAVKTKTLSSQVGFLGLFRKVCILFLVVIAHMLDSYVLADGNVFRTAVVLYYVGNEGISILENTANLGVQYPKKLLNALEQLKTDNDSD